MQLITVDKIIQRLRERGTSEDVIDRVRTAKTYREAVDIAWDELPWWERAWGRSPVGALIGILSPIFKRRTKIWHTQNPDTGLTFCGRRYEPNEINVFKDSYYFCERCRVAQWNRAVEMHQQEEELAAEFEARMEKQAAEYRDAGVDYPHDTKEKRREVARRMAALSVQMQRSGEHGRGYITDLDVTDDAGEPWALEMAENEERFAKDPPLQERLRELPKPPSDYTPQQQPKPQSKPLPQPPVNGWSKERIESRRAAIRYELGDEWTQEREAAILYKELGYAWRAK